MMELYIRIKDGQPFEHPIMGDNFRQAFPEIDVNNLPSEFAKFERIFCEFGPYEVHLNSTYEWVDGIVKDVHYIRPMTDEEKLAKQDDVKARWRANNEAASWVFIEERCRYESPVPYPTDDKPYRWDEPTTSWIEITA
jgi:hypothetical protein